MQTCFINLSQESPQGQQSLEARKGLSLPAQFCVPQALELS